jgi:hypothetical protein
VPGPTIPSTAGEPGPSPSPTCSTAPTRPRRRTPRACRWTSWPSSARSACCSVSRSWPPSAGRESRACGRWPPGGDATWGRRCSASARAGWRSHWWSRSGRSRASRCRSWC